MKTPKSSKLKTFVAAKDFEQSKNFYHDLGFELTWQSDKIAQFKVGDFQF